jgi:hypothetical protein
VNRDPSVDGLESDGIGIGVDAALDVEEEVTQEVGFHAHVGEVVVHFADLGIMAEAALDEFIAAFVTD